MITWQVEPDAAAVTDAACHSIHRIAEEAIAARGHFHCVLAGGNTPLATYRRLAVSEQSWERWSLYYGDERCVPADDPMRNSAQIAATGLPARVGGHFPIPTELGCAAAASAYADRIAGVVPFDLVLLGIGEDGHTASLFPGHEWPDTAVFSVTDAPKPPPQRVTLGVKALQNCRAMLVLITGAGKAVAVQQWRGGAPLPIAHVADPAGARVILERDCLSIAHDQASKPRQEIE
jgi:6-phosphogluconolactonase